ncbi:hypothetical protein B0H10DRAFT_2054148 [Mycena sp. CBHHK59/15]|nr:hypothetical protein B0H10DRAFT_2054148 [Mycena sp. CBHHK59/15]
MVLRYLRAQVTLPVTTCWVNCIDCLLLVVAFSQSTLYLLLSDSCTPCRHLMPTRRVVRGRRLSRSPNVASKPSSNMLSPPPPQQQQLG